MGPQIGPEKFGLAQGSWWKLGGSRESSRGWPLDRLTDRGARGASLAWSDGSRERGKCVSLSQPRLDARTEFPVAVAHGSALPKQPLALCCARGKTSRETEQSKTS
jgi:hypothetical protein